MMAASPTCNPEEAENSDGGESESVDSHDAVVEESETDKEKEFIIEVSDSCSLHRLANDIYKWDFNGCNAAHDIYGKIAREKETKISSSSSISQCCNTPLSTHFRSFSDMYLAKRRLNRETIGQDHLERPSTHTYTPNLDSCCQFVDTQTLKEALRVAAAQRQLQRNKAKNNSNTIRSVISNNSNNNNNNNSNSNNNNSCGSALNDAIGNIGSIGANTNVQATATFPLLAPFLLPGLTSASTAGTSNAIMYQIPQGVVYTNDEGADNNPILASNNGNGNNSAENQQTSPQFMFPINSLTLQQV
uniref:Protein FAR1-RELATED SEQUENCE n=1 Tax=Setaria digitata TaxID=48799 RepID=A0A915PN91_9BILA